MTQLLLRWATVAIVFMFGSLAGRAWAANCTVTSVGITHRRGFLLTLNTAIHKLGPVESVVDSRKA
jgi:hypothetical protein